MRGKGQNAVDDAYGYTEIMPLVSNQKCLHRAKAPASLPVCVARRVMSFRPRRGRRRGVPTQNFATRRAVSAPSCPGGYRND